MKASWVACGLFVLTVLATPAMGEDLEYFVPNGAAYNPEIPLPAEIVGYDIGDYVSRPGTLNDYMRAVADASDRVQLETIGWSHERRPILLLTVSSPDNLARLDEIREQHLALSDPASTQTVVDDMPAITWLGFGVHGDEVSSMDAALLTVYHLAAATDPATVAQLENTVVLLVPVLNPDGYNRASTSLNTYRGEVPVANLQHVEHNGTWPRGRTNHYWFDLNRQWVARTQPEAQAWGRSIKNGNPMC